MTRKRNQIRNPNKIKLTDGLEGTFTFRLYPDGIKEFVLTGKYKYVKKEALAYFNMTNSTNFFTIELLSYAELESEFKKPKDFNKEIKALKKMFNKKK